MAVRCWHCGTALNKAAAGAVKQLQCVGCGAKLGCVSRPVAVAPTPRPAPDEPPVRPEEQPSEPHRAGGNPVAFLLAVLLLGGAGYFALIGYQTVTSWDRAPGHVVGLRIEGSDRVFARVQFSAANGRLYRFEEPCTWDTRTGESVEVVYRTADPNEASIETEVSALLGSVGPWIGAACLGVLGIFCLGWWRFSS